MSALPPLPARERTADGGYIFYVNSELGSDTNDGFTAQSAKATINAARVLAAALIDWAKTNYPLNEIRVAPGTYAETVGGLYYMRLRGYGASGGQTLVQHATASAMKSTTCINSIVENIKFLCNTQDTPVIDLGIVNYTEFRNCIFGLGAGVTGVAGIDTENSDHLTVVNCSFESGQANNLGYGIYARGGANKYLHQARIENNIILATTAGIYIAADCTASGAVIRGNVIGPNALLKGIDDDSGTTYCAGNFITAQDAIEHANSATQCIGNSVINNATGARETALS